MKTNYQKLKNILETYTDIYIFIILLIFPFIVNKDGFFHILECKWYSYLIIGMTYLTLNLVTLLYFYIFKKVNYFKNYKLSKVQLFAITLLIINILSCLLSPYLKDYNLLIGVGRGEGLIITSLYILSFLSITLFGKFKRKYILYFSLLSIIHNGICVLQYIGFNPLNMYQNGIGTHNVSFMGTIGNSDFISALYCILIPVSISSYLFLKDNSKKENIIHLTSIFLSFFILGIINVQSGKLALLIMLMLTFPLIIKNNQRLSKFLIILSLILMAYCTNIILNPEYHYDINKLGLYFKFNYIVILYLIVLFILIYLSKVLKNTNYNILNDKKLIKYYFIGISICGIFGIIIIYNINFSSGFLYEIHELLHLNFDDEFGTYRIFLWKRTLKLVKDYPLIGTGPDTFALRFMAKYTEDIKAIGPLTINDTAANVYLTTLINLGVIGLSNYLLLMFSLLKKGLKEMNNYSKVLLLAFICYLIQDFFNLSVVIVSPIFWLLMGVLYISLNTDNLTCKKGIKTI